MVTGASGIDGGRRAGRAVMMMMVMINSDGGGIGDDVRGDGRVMAVGGDVSGGGRGCWAEVSNTQVPHLPWELAEPLAGGGSPDRGGSGGGGRAGGGSPDGGGSGGGGRMPGGGGGPDGGASGDDRGGGCGPGGGGGGGGGKPDLDDGPGPDEYSSESEDDLSDSDVHPSHERYDEVKEVVRIGLMYVLREYNAKKACLWVLHAKVGGSP
ncbi:hypothetical protein C8F01DRAFT_1085762 [Mycena amicta]|nr:hypothetical protein C8F01DRAFT_1085762 [Mycena amicta]